MKATTSEPSGNVENFFLRYKGTDGTPDYPQVNFVSVEGPKKKK